MSNQDAVNQDAVNQGALIVPQDAVVVKQADEVQVTSFTQDQKFFEKSERFKVIQPSMIRDVLDSHGFDLVHLKSGRAKNPERATFQTTVARYRSRDDFEIDGLKFDLIFKVPHLYGRLVGVLGLFRGTCSNQMNVGQWFNCVKVSHTGNPIDQLNQMIPQLVAQRQMLIDQVRAMQAKEVTPTETAQLLKSIGDIRLLGIENIHNVNYRDLAIVRRDEDRKNDLFTVLNVIQENVLRYGMRYQTLTTNEDGTQNVRNMVTRKVREQSVNAIDLNSAMWDKAFEILKAA